MKKYLILINGYLSNFWSSLLLLTIGCSMIVLLDPISLVIYFGKNQEFLIISTIIWRFFTLFLIPLAVVSIIVAVIIWLKDKTKNNYKGFYALLIVILTLGALFLFDLRLTILNKNIIDGRFDFITGDSLTADVNKNLYKTIQDNRGFLPETEKQNEKLLNTPAEIKNIYNKDNVIYLSIDRLDQSSEFIPGKNSFFVNTNKKIRDVSVDSNTKAYICGLGSDNNITTADELTATDGVLKYIKNLISINEPAIYYFDIENDKVQTIYQQCLPE